jgi:rhizosphere induced protein
MDALFFKLQVVTTPVGSIVAFAGNVAPYKAGVAPDPAMLRPEDTGWMLCDGSSLKIADYPELYRALGTIWNPKGAETGAFYLPNLQGQFLRGVGTDPASTEDRKAADGITSKGVGSEQTNALRDHEHNYAKPVTVSPTGEGEGNFAVNDDNAITANTLIDGEQSVYVSKLETRPTNVFVHYLIKYTSRLPEFRGFPGML